MDRLASRHDTGSIALPAAKAYANPLPNDVLFCTGYPLVFFCYFDKFPFAPACNAGSGWRTGQATLAGQRSIMTFDCRDSMPLRTTTLNTSS
jgi:hypothetical protein